MERSTANISYKGSVTDAISETQKQKKLFVVYISGDDADSTLLEQSVWADSRVAVSISKYCIFLHLVQGSVDAIQFSAIYPQKSVPSITAVGYNGIKLWQHEGYTSVENFVASIEKAWASLHLQETTLTLLTQALASKKPETLGSNSQAAGENASTSNTGSLSGANVIDNLEDKPTEEPKLPEQEMISETVKANDKMPGLQTSLQSNTAVKVKEDPNTPQRSKRENVGSVNTDVHSSMASRDIDISVIPEETKETKETPEINTMVKDEKTKKEEVSEPVGYSNVVKSNDINLNIRMPDGGSLKRNFMTTDTLGSVKQYIDENQGSGISSYDLAIPYPRKVFTEQEMDIILSELGFAARQALMVVPHRQANIPPATSNPQLSTSMVVSTDSNNGGYFALLKRALSFVNPFSYLGGSTNSSNFEPAPHTPRAQSNSYQYQPYRPNDALQGRLLSGTASSSRPSVQTQTNHNSANQSTGEIRRTARPFGSNIHTLKHDEDDMQSRDSNTFWNGNSTQYGGDDKK